MGRDLTGGLATPPGWRRVGRAPHFQGGGVWEKGLEYRTSAFVHFEGILRTIVRILLFLGQAGESHISDPTPLSLYPLMLLKSMLLKGSAVHYIQLMDCGGLGC